MKDDRRRFLHVLGAAAAALAAPACGSAVDGHPSPSETIGGGGAGGASGAGGAGGAGGPGGGGQCQDPAGVNVGLPSMFAANGLHKVTGTVVLVGRDANGLYAMSSLCTHQFCNMNKAQDGTILGGGNAIRCDCHNSVFDKDGKATAGPAFSPLRHYAVAVGCDGTLRVDTKTIVTSSTRFTG